VRDSESRKASLLDPVLNAVVGRAFPFCQTLACSSGFLS
jgi:hypothetical protein